MLENIKDKRMEMRLYKEKEERKKTERMKKNVGMRYIDRYIHR